MPETVHQIIVKMQMQNAKMHNILKPLCWLMGTWKTVSARIEYPTKFSHPRPFKEILTFKSLGQPQLKFDSMSWHPKTLLPLHIQNGYLYIDEPGRKVILVTSHSLGFAVVEVGTVKDCSMKLESLIIGHSDLSPKKVVNFTRAFSLNESGQLIYKMMLQTEDEHNLFNHLKVVYEKDSCHPHSSGI